MKFTIKSFVITLFLGITFISCKAQNNSLAEFNKTIEVASKTDCEKKEGYWYNKKCWANYNDFDDGVAKEDIDKEVDKQLNAAKGFGLKLDRQSFDIDFFFPERNFEENEFLMISLFSDNGKTKTLLITTAVKNAEKEVFPVDIVLFNENLIALSEEDKKNISSFIVAQGSGSVKSKGKEEAKVFDIQGNLTNIKEGRKTPLTMKAGFALTGIGNTTLKVKGSKAYLNGTLGAKAFKQFKNLIENHKEVKTIVLQNVPGSINDAVNMHTGRIIREAGLNTMVLSDSQISSGGVDLFCAGNERIVTKGARLGIHSWGGDGVSAHQVPKDHPAHQYQLAYFTMSLGKEKGPGFISGH